MKIILVHNTYQQPGGEDVVFEQERQLLERAGQKVITYCRSNHEIEELSAIERATLVKRSIWATDTHHEFSRLLGRENPDVVHVHNTFLMISPSIYSACQERDVPVVQTLHNYRLLCPAATFFRDGKVCEECVDHSLLRSVLHGCYRNSRPATASVAVMLAWHRYTRTWSDRINCYIALTDFARNKFIAAGFSPEKIVVKPNFVDPDPGERERPGDHAVCLGRLSQEKGLLTLLDAWKGLPGNHRLQIIGDGPEREVLESRVCHDNLSGVVIRGRLPHGEVISAMKNARCLILASVWYEGFPMCIAEAFACGTPVICSRLGGMQEIVDDGRTGLLFEPGNADDLAVKIEWAWSHPAELQAMGREARREYEQHYTAEKNYEQLMDIYEQTVETYA
jgi:glycosyltransferase involved in cell wall biosynthesis